MPEKVTFIPSYSFQNLKYIPKLDWQAIKPLKQEMDLFFNSNQLSFHNKQLANRAGRRDQPHS